MKRVVENSNQTSCASLATGLTCPFSPSLRCKNGMPYICPTTWCKDIAENVDILSAGPLKTEMTDRRQAESNLNSPAFSKIGKNVVQQRG